MRNEPDLKPLTLDELDALLTRVLEAQINRDPNVLTEDEVAQLQGRGIVIQKDRVLMTHELRDKINKALKT